MNLQDGVNNYDAGIEDVDLNLSGAGVMSNIRPYRLLLPWEDSLLAASQNGNMNIDG